MTGVRNALLFSTVLVASGCSYALYPHRTLDGRAFRFDVAAGIAPGTTEIEVLEKLGPPLEVLPGTAGTTVWRYHERARLRGCRTEVFGVIPWGGDTPVVTTDARLHLRDGAVTRVETARAGK